MATDPRTRQDMNIGMIVTITIISVCLLLVTVMAAQSWFRWEFAREAEAKSNNASNYELDALYDQQSASLNEAPVTIDHAMRQVAASAAKH